MPTQPVQMDEQKPFSMVVDALAEACPICGQTPLSISIDGPQRIVLERCGHVFDAKDWLDRQYESD